MVSVSVSHWVGLSGWSRVEGGAGLENLEMRVKIVQRP